MNIEALIARLSCGHNMEPFGGIGTVKGLVGAEPAAYAKGLNDIQSAWFWYLVYNDWHSQQKLTEALVSRAKIESPADKKRFPGLVLYKFTLDTKCSRCGGSGEVNDTCCNRCNGRGSGRLSEREAAASLGWPRSTAQSRMADIRAAESRCVKYLIELDGQVMGKVYNNLREA